MNSQKLKPYVYGFCLVVVVLVIGFSLKHYVSKKAPAPATQAPVAKIDKEILTYQQTLLTNPKDVNTLLLLASDYQQKARDTADPSYYTKIDLLTQQAEKLDPNNGDVYLIEGALALSRHHFPLALSLGQKAVSLNPNKSVYYGVIADAQTELGDNADAVNTLQTMVNMNPDYSAYSRIAYARELHGDINGAEAAINTAVEAGSTYAENQAWGYNQLGILYERNDLPKALEQFNLAIGAVPNYAPALEQLARVDFVQGDSQKAISLLQQAQNVVPLAQYYIDLGEVYQRTGDTTKAAQQYELAKLAFQAAASGDVDSNMENSLFLSEHDLDYPTSLTLALKSLPTRGSIYGDDAVAWAYYKNNDLVNAQKYITMALRLGDYDPGIVFHAAQIAEAAGNKPAAKQLYQTVLNLNPSFSFLYNGIAQEKLKQL